MENLKSAVEAVLFASGDSIPVSRLSLVFECAEEDILSVFSELKSEYEERNSGISLLKLDNRLQMCSAPDYSEFVIKALEQRRPSQLSQPSLEVLSVVAYFQPVTKAYIDAVRGVDCTYTIGVLLDKGLIENSGRLDVPGRPALYSTTDVFLRTMGISSLDELPVLPDLTESEGVQKLQHTIERLQNEINPDQISINDLKSQRDSNGE